jgi:hypothetical protein
MTASVAASAVGVVADVESDASSVDADANACLIVAALATGDRAARLVRIVAFATLGRRFLLVRRITRVTAGRGVARRAGLIAARALRRGARFAV